MSTNVNLFKNESTALEVVKTMSDCDVDYVIVVQSGKPTGIITTRDVLVRAVEHGMPLSSIIARMIYTNPLVTIDEDATVEEAVKLMKQWSIKHLPVTKNDRLVGLLTHTDIAFAVPAMLSEISELCRAPQR